MKFSREQEKKKSKIKIDKNATTIRLKINPLRPTVPCEGHCSNCNRNQSFLELREDWKHHTERTKSFLSGCQSTCIETTESNRKMASFLGQNMARLLVQQMQLFRLHRTPHLAFVRSLKTTRVSVGLG